MKVIKVKDLIGSEREVNCPKGEFKSLRILLKEDGMGYTLTHTTIHLGQCQVWHYKDHLETCYCVKGLGLLTNLETLEEFWIRPGMVYVLDKNERHHFFASKETTLICVFNPPLNGKEIHKEDGSYGL